MAIYFFEEGVKFSLPEKNKHKKWLKDILADKNYFPGEINFIFCSDEFLYRMNVEYLNHESLTDIITFDNSEEEKVIEGDIFISIDRIEENAKINTVLLEDEMRRVMSHGILHLMGYRDKEKNQKEEMRKMENYALLLFKQHDVSRGTS